MLSFVRSLLSPLCYYWFRSNWDSEHPVELVNALKNKNTNCDDRWGMVMNRIKRTDWHGGRWAVRRNSTRVGVSGASNVELFERLPNGNISHRRWRLMGIVSINILSSAARSAGPIQIRASETRIIEMRNNRHYVEDWNSYCREEGPSSDNCSAALRCSAVPSGCYHLLPKLPTQIFNSIEYENASRIYLKGLESQYNGIGKPFFCYSSHSQSKN